MRSRVMPGSLVTMERRVPVRRLNSVDLPTLGRPTMTSDGSFSDMLCWAGRTERLPGGGGTLQCSAFAPAPVEKERAANPGWLGDVKRESLGKGASGRSEDRPTEARSRMA